MALFKLSKLQPGQALAETILIIPLLVLMLGGTIQLALIFQAKVAFDKASADVAREYAAGTINDPATFKTEFWLRLGTYQNHFDKNSLSIGVQPPKPSPVDALLQKIDSAGPIAAKLRSYIVNYGGNTWTVQINYISQFSPAFIFPNGIRFQNQVTILRYPA